MATYPIGTAVQERHGRIGIILGAKDRGGLSHNSMYYVGGFNLIEDGWVDGLDLKPLRLCTKHGPIEERYVDCQGCKKGQPPVEFPGDEEAIRSILALIEHHRQMETKMGDLITALRQKYYQEENANVVATAGHGNRMGQEEDRPGTSSEVNANGQ